ncbi:MAG TPA: hypothetical protein VL326_06630 [Kofleriaceae bacterium]|jgi:formylmethanofuran dehydrogenase subunit E|nr:hypothetical protein [Kofleriaceae bacterium]
MPPAALVADQIQDSSKPIRARCTQCGERIEQREAKPREKPLCDDCSFDNVPFTD